MFTNLTYQDKQAFFALLDEYFESRPQYAHLRGAAGGIEKTPSPGPGGLAPPSIDSSSRPRSGSATSGASSAGAGSGRALPPPVVHGGPIASPPVRRYSPSADSPAHTPTTTHSHVGGSGLTTSSSRADGIMGATKSLASSGYSLGKTGVGKFAQNSHVSGAMGKIGAGGFNAKLAKAGDKPKTYGSSLGGTAASSPITPRSGGAPQPPPSRGAAAAAKQGNRAQALYDYEGGDETDLPVKENQMISIVAKTSDDWWTCEDDSGRQGLVPANYLKEV